MNSEEVEKKELVPEADERSMIIRFKDFLKQVFDLNLDKENDFRTIEVIKADVDFKGTKLWILICAIFIASLGLNVNSTAVIIGAMLISPLMGPIIGLGLSLGIYDLPLMRRSLRNYGVSTLISIITATLYFLITPLSHVQSELLARTQPTIYDVLIAFFGGLAGILANASKNKGNVLPGVAIATALMPPLCTAGFGLATANWSFFFGAFYLYIINSVFIAIATYLVVRLRRFPRKAMTDPKRERKVRQLITTLALCTFIPSVYLGFLVVKDSFTRQSAQRFIDEQLNSVHNQVIKSSIQTKKGRYVIDAVLIGSSLDARYLDSLRSLMPEYGLKNVQLNIKQGFDKQDVNVNELKTVVLKDLYDNSARIIQEQQRSIDSLTNMVKNYDKFFSINMELNQEVRLLFPKISDVTLAPTPQYAMGRDSVLLIVVKPEDKISTQQIQKLTEWLKARTNSKYVRLVLDN